MTPSTTPSATPVCGTSPLPAVRRQIVLAPDQALGHEDLRALSGGKRKGRNEQGTGGKKSKPAGGKLTSGDETEEDTASRQGTGGGGGGRGVQPLTTDTKKLRRLMRNRASAQLSRERKRQYMADLEVCTKRT